MNNYVKRFKNSFSNYINQSIKMEKQNKKVTYTRDQFRDLVADVLTELVIELEDPSLAIASVLAMKLLAKKLK